MNTEKKTFSLKMWVSLLLIILVSAAILGREFIQNKFNSEPVVVSKSFVRGDKAVQFVEIKNMIITLKDNKTERYLQLELGVATGDDNDIKKVVAMVPVIQAATVNLLSHMDYQAVRQTSIVDIRRQLMNEYKKDFEKLNAPMPFDDVVISRMVFQ
ncbi:TPA: flagellar basal body-associated FliL family protein [Yersinia enterocolitica]|uniref:flagellar basal body-associated FliL family protein n=1 Tax=Yersinia enterocolitica TaxID=630 RepID=UPI00094B8217|nr:flagellar basal body-associated FliL family protein [Yersinia enterocolitica]MBW5833572.1 flagellar basal body-associated FliL family protein [Yersinia enterocolitica]HEN3568061.1 flagellar basal body-associated FliL family protein [Yersinia enterocolitica]HEN3571167.1 flagellar basal body-associated FliL family protein [Yersinia enterocolitica]HEN3576539.1 flagellar basal body-associated FliL family protein [Yersinia enterocolitica]HEN3606560.1 flagellar basal body-associated FliL family p